MAKLYSISFEESNVSKDELIEKFKAIPEETEVLHLIGALWYQTDRTSALLETLPLIPKKVTTLDMAHNFLGNDQRLIRLFMQLSPAVNKLQLAHNELHKMGVDALVQALKYLPGTVNTLDFEGNDFHLFSGSDLVKIFAAIPSGVTCLNLGYIPDATQIEAFKHLPKTLKTLIVHPGDLRRCVKFERLVSLRNAVPPWIKFQTDFMNNSPDCPVITRIHQLIGLANNSKSVPVAQSGAAASVSLTQAASNAIAQKTGSPMYAQAATAGGVLKPSPEQGLDSKMCI